MWLLRRVGLISAVLLIVAVGVVVIARLDRASDRLLALGFDLCDGEPCWRGIKPGMPWNKAIEMSAYAKLYAQGPNLEQEHAGSSVIVSATIDMASVDRIVLAARSLPYLLPITVGEIVAKYGSPCRVEESYDSNGPVLRLMYPAITAVVPFNPSFRRGVTYVEADTPLTFFYLRKSDQVQCSDDAAANPEGWYGVWHGFATNDVYHGRDKSPGQ
jgi:hypothetical protein